MMQNSMLGSHCMPRASDLHDTLLEGGPNGLQRSDFTAIFACVCECELRRDPARPHRIGTIWP